MTTIAPIPFTDADLLRVATTPRKRLFPSLYRASAFAPLILVCCILPSFLLLTHTGLNEEGSLWGLRSLAFANATTIEAQLKPGLNEAGEPLLFQPPLAAWLNGSVAGLLGPSHPLSTSLVSLVATAIAIWLATRCAWRIGGAHTALIAALLMCSHPQVLESAIVPTNSAVGMCLLLASVFGFQRHLQRGASPLSSGLLISGITWGLSILAIGPISFTLPLIFLFHALRYARTLPIENEGSNVSERIRWPAFRSIIVFTLIGLAVGGWWEAMMFSQHGSVFLHSWWSSLPLECLKEGGSEWTTDLCPALQQSWRGWLRQTAPLLGWLLVGWGRAWYECQHTCEEPARRRYQLLLYWWSLTIVGRLFMEFAGMVTVTNTSAWNVALLAPTILMASLGFGSLIERAIIPAGEFVLVIVVAGLTLSNVTASSVAGIACTAVAFLLLIFGPRLLPSTSGNSHAGNSQIWGETGWRRLLKMTVYASLAASLLTGFRTQNSEAADEYRLADLKTRIDALPDVCRISLIASRDPIPVGLEYVLRRRWPKAEIITTEGWDTGLTQAMELEANSPSSRFLVLEWTRRDIRVSANTGQAWQVSAVGNPMRFYGRRLSLVLIGPKL
jgi:hypothetical protein